MVMSSFLAGAEMMTFLAPPWRCSAAWSRSVNRPVDSSTTSTPSSFQGSLAGSFSASTRMASPPTTMPSFSAVTSAGKRPCTESYLSRWASVAVSVMSLTATKSSSLAPIARAARTTLRPIRPKPLMPTRIAIITPSLDSLPEPDRRLGSRERHRLDPRGPGLVKRGRRLRERRAGREYVVHQHTGETGGAACLERAGDVGLSAFRGERGLGARLAAAAEQVRAHRTAGPERQRLGDPLALVIPPRSEPARTERNRYQGYLPGQWFQVPHGLRERLRHPPPSLVLEAVHCVARGASEPDRAPYPRESRGPPDAEPALHVAEGGLAATLAERGGNRLPARAAQITDERVPLARRDRRLAEKARGREQPALDPGQRFSEGAHRSRLA